MSLLSADRFYFLVNIRILSSIWAKLKMYGKNLTEFIRSKIKLTHSHVDVMLGTWQLQKITDTDT